MITDNTNMQTETETLTLPKDFLFEDFKTSVVIVSLLANLALFVTWLTTVVK